ncbi:metal-dependent hydrolase [Nocardiopsis alba]|uniref:metal-dependent hydrolase n=1 Tax=Nocardiopsis alba TaxID=53437 RepID=UPI0033B9E5A5
MMGRTHALTGWASATLTLPLLGVTDPRLVLVAGMTAAGATLLPDVDSPSSTMTQALGPVTRLLSRLMRWLSKRMWVATATRYDREDPRTDVGHRHLTHTVPACVAAGVVAWGTVVGVAAVLTAPSWGLDTELGSAVAAGLVCGAVSVPAARYLMEAVPAISRREAARVAPVVGVVVALCGAWAHLDPVWVGVVVGAGALVGVAGDWLTPHGVPLFWPVAYRGKRWWMHRCRWTFTTGADSREEALVRWTSIGLGVTSWVVMVPGW